MTRPAAVKPLATQAQRQRAQARSGSDYDYFHPHFNGGARGVWTSYLSHARDASRGAAQLRRVKREGPK